MHPFPYIQEAAIRFGVDAVQIRDPRGKIFDQNRFIDSLTDADIEVLARIYCEIEDREDTRRLSEWIREARPIAGERRRVFLLLAVFDLLGKQGRMPFARGAVRYVGSDDPPLDWTKLPSELRIVASGAERYGRYQFDDEIRQLFSSLTCEEYHELKRIREIMDEHARLVDEFIDRHPMKEHEEAQLLFFLSMLLNSFDFSEEESKRYCR